jgi:hypothetical protein
MRSKDGRRTCARAQKLYSEEKSMHFKYINGIANSAFLWSHTFSCPQMITMNYVFPIAPFILSFSVHYTLGEPCQPCGDSQYQMATPGATFYAGVEEMSCRDLVAIAGDRRHGTDVCYLVMNYALEHCNCMDAYSNPAPDLPYKDSTAPCNICGGSRGSDFWMIDSAREEESVPTSLGISVKCGFLFQTSLEGAFLPSQCPSVQDATRNACGCALCDSTNGNAISGGSRFPKLWYITLLIESLLAVTFV